MSLLLVNANTLHIPLADGSVHMALTSPPYWGLRSYAGTATWEGGDSECDHCIREDPHIESSTLAGGKDTVGHQQQQYADVCRRCGAVRIDAQLGLEKLHDCLGWATGAPCGECFICHCRQWAREVWRVLRDDGMFWLNIGDSYAGTGYGKGTGHFDQRDDPNAMKPKTEVPPGLKPKDMCLIPQRLALALQADGWYVRSEIIWAKCLSGGATVYAQTQKGEMPMMVKDVVRLDPSTVKLWDGEKWNQVISWEEAKPDPDRKAKSVKMRRERYLGGNPPVACEIEIELRNGERIGCTRNHKWPTLRGLLLADELKIGDVIQATRLPEPEHPRMPKELEDYYIGWFIGMYIAEGSQSQGTIQIASHIKENKRFELLCEIAEMYDGHCFKTKTTNNGMTISINSPVLVGVINAYVSGHDAKTKHLHTRCWKRSNIFLTRILDGYLEGDAHKVDDGKYRLAFTNNDALAQDLRTLCARWGFSLRLRRRKAMANGKEFPMWRGDLCFGSQRRNSPDTEIVAIRQSRARKFWSISLAEDPHLFALASGTLTGNSNPMPESVTDRPTKSHETVWLLAKNQHYYYDQDAVREVYTKPLDRWGGDELIANGSSSWDEGTGQSTYRDRNMRPNPAGRNRRDVWQIATAPYSGAHFATWPPALVEPMIKAGTSERGCCPNCGKQWERVVEKGALIPDNPLDIHGRMGMKYSEFEQVGWDDTFKPRHHREKIENGWRPSCSCPPHDPVPCTILDPFAGSGTSLLVARQLGRNAIGLDLSFPYLHEQARARLSLDALDAWVNGKKDGKVITDLPLFATLD